MAHPNLAALIDVLARLAPVIEEAVQVLQTAVPAGQLPPFVQKIEDAIKTLEDAIAAHKAPPAT